MIRMRSEKEGGRQLTDRLIETISIDSSMQNSVMRSQSSLLFDMSPTLAWSIDLLSFICENMANHPVASSLFSREASDIENFQFFSSCPIYFSTFHSYLLCAEFYDAIRSLLILPFFSSSLSNDLWLLDWMNRNLSRRGPALSCSIYFFSLTGTCTCS